MSLLRNDLPLSINNTQLKDYIYIPVIHFINIFINIIALLPAFQLVTFIYLIRQNYRTLFLLTRRHRDQQRKTAHQQRRHPSAGRHIWPFSPFQCHNGTNPKLPIQWALV